jgi:hypothetical protein
MAVLQYIYIPKRNDYRNRNIVYNNYYIVYDFQNYVYIDNCKLKKTRIRLMGCSVKSRWIWRKKHFIYILYFIMSMFIAYHSCSTTYSSFLVQNIKLYYHFGARTIIRHLHRCTKVKTNLRHDQYHALGHSLLYE